MRSWCLFSLLALSVATRAANLNEVETVVVEDAKALAALTVVGGKHCDETLPGTFADRAGAALTQMAGLRKQLLKDEPYESTAAFNEAARRGTPFKPSPVFATWMKAASVPARQVRAALCSEQGRVGAALTLFGMFDDAPYSWIELADALRLALVDAWSRPDDERELALSAACLDSLAAAELASPQGLVGRMVAASLVTPAVPACEAAINGADRAQLEVLVPRLRALSTRPSFSTTLAAERVFGQLTGFAQVYSPEALSELPSAAQGLIKWGLDQAAQDPPFAAGARRFLFGQWARRGHFKQMEEAMKAVDELPAEEAIVELDELLGDDPLALSLVGLPDSFTGTASNWGFYLRRDLEHRALLQMILVGGEMRLNHLRLTGWPKSLDELAKRYDRRAADSLQLSKLEYPPSLYLARPADPSNPPPIFNLEE